MAARIWTQQNSALRARRGIWFLLFNPLDELRIGTEHEVGDVQNLTLLIVDPDGKGLRSDNHWQKTAYSLLVGCILHLCYKGKVEGTPATFAALDQMLADSSRPIQDLWTEMLAYQRQKSSCCFRVSA